MIYILVYFFPLNASMQDRRIKMNLKVMGSVMRLFVLKFVYDDSKFLFQIGIVCLCNAYIFIISGLDFNHSGRSKQARANWKKSAEEEGSNTRTQ